MKKWMLTRCSLHTAGIVGKTFLVLCSDIVEGILGQTDGWMDTHVCALRHRILHLEFMLAGRT